MFALTSQIKVFLCRLPTDMRKVSLPKTPSVFPGKDLRQLNLWAALARLSAFQDGEERKWAY